MIVKGYKISNSITYCWRACIFYSWIFLGILRLELVHWAWLVFQLEYTYSVEARVKRHLNKKKTLRWHIDYLTSSEDVEPIYAVVLPLTRNYECRIAKILQENDSISINNFGASDCRCKSHLYNIKSPSRLIMKIKRTLNLKKPIKCMKIYGDFTIR
jgi:Uri superfamily endonuclease